MKGQASIEFFILVSVLLIIASVFIAGGFSLQEKLLFTRINKELQKTVDGVAFEINSALKAGNGYTRKFYVDENLGFNYTLSIEDYSVFIEWDGRSSSSNILTNSVIGNVEKGWNVIRNVDGVIYVD